MSVTNLRRVLMTCDTIGGVFTYALDLCRILGNAGVDVTLASMGRTMSPQQRLDARSVPRLRVIESHYRLEWMDDAWEDVERSGQWLLELEREFSPDIVHLNGYSHGALPFRAPVMIVGHSCVLSWWEAVHRERAPRHLDAYTSHVRRGLGYADVVVAPSTMMLESLERNYGPLGTRVVIPNGCDLGERAEQAERAGQHKQELVFAAGRIWDRAKNLETLGRASLRISCPVYVAGDLTAPAGVSGDVRAEDMMRAMRALGQLRRDEMWAWFARAAIYVLPARYEPFGLSVLEAASAGCALVLGDVPSLREHWEDAAVFVPTDDASQLARVINALIDVPALREELSERARDRAARYDLASFGARYMHEYELLAQRTPRCRERSAARGPALR